MPFIPIPTGVMVECIYTLNNQRVENVYHCTKGVPATNADLTNLTTLFRNWENASARTTRTNQTNLVQIDATALDADGSPAVSVPIIPFITGSQAWGVSASFVTLAVKHTTGLAGRSYRGRTYHIGIGWQIINTGDTLTQGQADLIAGTYNTLRTTLLNGGWTLCVASKYSGVEIVNGRRRAIPRAQGILTPISASVAERSLDTNRHRKLPHQV